MSSSASVGMGYDSKEGPEKNETQWPLWEVFTQEDGGAPHEHAGSVHAADAETALHPSCTARMGVDDLSVLDPESMRVHGVDGLRVVDASAMPYVTNGNIYAPVMMLAEKSADLILGNTPLPPSDAPFYRFREGDPLDPPASVGHRTGDLR